MGIMVHSLLWVLQDFYHQPQGHKAARQTDSSVHATRLCDLCQIGSLFLGEKGAGDDVRKCHT